jgi:ABC-type nitrate/sulfonate/bicarbonate transport system, ATPase component
MPQTAAPKIAASDLTVVFGSPERQVTALDRVNLSVTDNEFVCVMGPSGCGKTTLLNLIAGHLGASSGSLTVNGSPVTGPGADRAVVFQDNAVFPWMTVEDNVGYSLRMRGRPNGEVRDAVDHYLARVGLTDFRKAWPNQLSGGMRKRVDIARCYAANPEVLLMDEPYGALDIMTKERLQEELRTMWLEQPKTIFFITHDLEESIFLGDRVILMSPRPGRIAAEYRPRLPARRDMSIKTTPEFVSLAKELREALQAFH